MITAYIVREYNGFPIEGFFVRTNAEIFCKEYKKQTGRSCEIDRVKLHDYQEFLNSRISCKEGGE
jgi:hypothetical protein